ncbi:MAG: type II-A CRISPR-associated protein Csn2 [Lachnospiraceae bacterium]
MRCVNIEYLIDLEWKEFETLHLVVENPSMMEKIICELKAMSNGEEGSFVFSEQRKEIKFEKSIELIVDPFGIDFNSRQVIAKLYSELVKAEELFVLDKAEINSKILCYLEKISAELAYDTVSFELNLDTTKLLKMYDVKLNPEYLSLIEKLTEYMKMVSLLLKKCVIILVNIKSYLNFDDICKLKNMALYYKVYLMLIDNFEGQVQEDDIVYIIDKDNCLIKK